MKSSFIKNSYEIHSIIRNFARYSNETFDVKVFQTIYIESTTYIKINFVRFFLHHPSYTMNEIVHIIQRRSRGE